MIETLIENITPEVIAKLKKIKFLVTDIDGTLTDTKVYYTKNGEEFKAFSVRDGMGMNLLRRAGIETAFLTSESSEIVQSRADKLKIEHVIMGSRNKKKDLLELAERVNLKLEEIAYLGDDVNDAIAMELSGVSACPSNAVESIKGIADIVCKTEGGYGTLRELAEIILISQNKSNTLPESW